MNNLRKEFIMDDVFAVEHIYEKDEIEEIKFIGIFSSIERAKDAIKFLYDKPGFRDHPFECFKIDKVKVDAYEWKDGFISWEEAMK